MARFDTIIRGGMIIDGTRVPRRRADLGISNGRVAQIGRLDSRDAERVFDAGDCRRILDHSSGCRRFDFWGDRGWRVDRRAA